MLGIQVEIVDITRSRGLIDQTDAEELDNHEGVPPAIAALKMMTFRVLLERTRRLKRRGTHGMARTRLSVLSHHHLGF